LVAYAGHIGYKWRNGLVRVNERFIDALYLITVMQNNGYLPVVSISTTANFKTLN
jgi:hypothetical protein